MTEPSHRPADPVSPTRERIDLFIDSVRIRYNLRREYFTVGVPVVLALLLIAGTVLTGAVDLGGGTEEIQKNDKELAYEELVKQMEAEERGEVYVPEGSEGKEPPPGAEAKPGIDHVLIWAVIIAILPYAIDVSLQKRTRRKQEELYTEFLFKLSELMRGGLDPIKSVRELAKTELGVLTPHVRLAANSMEYGRSFEDSMRLMTVSLKSELISRYTELVIQASYSGGSVSDLILKSSEDMRTILMIEREKEGSLSQYILIFYFAQGIIVFIAYTLTDSLLPFFSDLGNSSFMGSNGIADVDFPGGFFHLLVINSFFGGLIIGKISEGDVRYGLKHCAVLMAGCYLACSFLILPGPDAGGSGEVVIEIVSGYDQEGIGGFPLREPIVVKILDLEGNPVGRAAMEVAIEPGGSVPAVVKTNPDGEGTIDVVLGEAEGTHTVTITIGGVSETVMVVAGEA
jgi:flagellar protein FlaJ